MNEGRISTRYARALLATHTGYGNARAVYEQAKDLAFLLRAGAVEIAPVLHSNVVSVERKRQFILHLVEHVAPLLGPFAELMFDRHRGMYFERALLVFLDLYRRQERVVWAEVRVAQPLDAAQQQRISALVSQSFSGTVELITQVEPELLGGFCLSVDGHVCDRSVRGELNRLRNELI